MRKLTTYAAAIVQSMSEESRAGEGEAFRSEVPQEFWEEHRALMNRFRKDEAHKTRLIRKMRRVLHELYPLRSLAWYARDPPSHSLYESRDGWIVFDPTRIVDVIEDQRNAVHVLHEYARGHAHARIRVRLRDLTWGHVDTLLRMASAADCVRGAQLWATMPSQVERVVVERPRLMAGAHLGLRLLHTCMPEKVRRRMIYEDCV